MKKVCIQGLGFVGSAMSTAIALAKKNNKPLYEVVGIDLDTPEGNQRINAINNGNFPFETSDNKLKKSLKKCSRINLRASFDSNEFIDADIIVVDVPFDISYLDNEPKLNFSKLRSAIKVIGKRVKPKTLVLIETTVPPGTCEKIIVPCLEKELKNRSLSLNDIYIAHSYERVMPGKDYLSSITDYWRVFSGINNNSALVCELFLKSIINTKKFPLTRLETLTASETAKVLENSYRAANIAFIDEWTKFSEISGIDLFEIIEAIKLRPTHSNMMFPGLGVGGYCLTKDPSLAPAAAKKLFKKNLDFPFSKLAMKINEEMPMQTVKRLSHLLKGELSNKKILICGITYRQDIGDTRYSPVEKLYKELLKNKAKVTCHDPYIAFWNEIKIKIKKNISSTKKFDAIILAVPHAFYKKFDFACISSKRTIILDSNMVLNKNQIEDLKSKEFKVESIGRANLK